MADDVDLLPDTGVGTVPVAADELSSVNGVAQSAPLPKAQRVLVGYSTGSGAFWDITPLKPLPTRPATESKGNNLLTLTGVGTDAPTILTGATWCTFTPTADVHICDDGTTAAATDYLVRGGTEWIYDGNHLSSLKFFGPVGTTVYFWQYG